MKIGFRSSWQPYFLRRTTLRIGPVCTRCSFLAPLERNSAILGARKSWQSRICGISRQRRGRTSRGMSPRLLSRSHWMPPDMAFLGPPRIEKLRKAHSRLYRGWFLQENANFAAFCEIHKFCTLLHSSMKLSSDFRKMLRAIFFVQISSVFLSTLMKRCRICFARWEIVRAGHRRSEGWPRFYQACFQDCPGRRD